MSLSTRSAIIFPLVLLAFMALLTAWINHSVQPAQPKLDGSSRHDPDYRMNNFVTTQTDINGGLRYKLAATEMTHFPDDDSTNLQRPRYTQFSIGKPYTQVEALRGYVSSNGEQVQLVDNVKITRQAFAGKGEMTIDTAYLNVLPNQDLVRTDSPVVIRQAPKTIIYATGMVYEKDKRTVTLLHKVRAHYEKPSTASAPIAAKNVVTKPLATKPSNSTITAPNDLTSSPKDARIRRRYE